MKKTGRSPASQTTASGYAGVLGLAALFAAPLSASAADQPAVGKSGAGALVGQYALVDGEKDGKKIPDERIVGSTARITENTITTYDKDKKETYAVTYKLDTRKEPWRITMTSTRAPVTAEVAEGLIKKEGDVVNLIYGVRGGEIPNDFTTENNQLMFVMKKSGSQAAR
jgi:uncharacterized protein (TIGR03067 family)